MRVRPGKAWWGLVGPGKIGQGRELLQEIRDESKRNKRTHRS